MTDPREEAREEARQNRITAEKLKMAHELMVAMLSNPNIANSLPDPAKIKDVTVTLVHSLWSEFHPDGTR